MTGGDEERHLLLPSQHLHPAHSMPVMKEAKQLHLRPSAKGFMLTVFVAIGIFGVSVGAARYLFPQGKSGRDRVTEEQVGSLVDIDSVGAIAYSSRETWECAGDLSLPVARGADMVSYFSLELGESPKYGTAEHESVVGGYRFFFSSEGNKASFEEEPSKYFPAWGGFCSWGISREYWWTPYNLGPDADPEQWLIADDGVLYLFRGPLPLAMFLEDVPGNIMLGNAIWDDWWGGTAPAWEGGSPLDTACFCSPETCGK